MRKWLGLALVSVALGTGLGDGDPVAAFSGANGLLLGKDIPGGNVHLFWSLGTPPYTVSRGPLGAWGAAQPIATGLTTAAYDDHVLTDGQSYFYLVD